MRSFSLSVIALLAFACIADANPIPVRSRFVQPFRSRVNLNLQFGGGYGYNAPLIVPPQLVQPFNYGMSSLDYSARMLNSGCGLAPQGFLGVTGGCNTPQGLNGGYGGSAAVRLRFPLR